MSNMKIGEIRAFKCVEAVDNDNRCVGCMFNDESCCWSDTDISGHCSKAFREDNKEVMFVSTNPNEIIRERIEESIDKCSRNDDDKLILVDSGDCMIGLKASRWKQLLVDIMEVGDEDAVQD